MATTKITDLTAYTDPVNTDVLPIVDVTSDVTKKVSIANLMKNASLGTAAAPSIAFDGDPNTGIYSPGADQVGIATNGVVRLTASTSAVTSSLPVDVPLGTVSAPSLTFTGDLNTGIYSPGADQVAVATNGIQRVNFNAATEVVFNDGGADVDFRIEGDTKANLFKVDAGTDAVSIDGAFSVTGDATVGSLNGGPLAGTRNLIINGDMRIDQRNAGTVTHATGTSAAFPVDRFRVQNLNGTTTFSTQKSSTAPSGFTSSLLITTVTSGSPAAAASKNLCQYIEGFNIADLGWGTASAQDVVLSFWVRSSVTGDFGVGFANSDATRSYAASYSITAADTWEYKTVVIPGDTSGTWMTDNSTGVRVCYNLGSGSDWYQPTGVWGATGYGRGAFSGVTSLLATAAATFYITGVQLEAGTVATPFERRSYGQELMLAQRYCQVIPAFRSSNFDAYVSYYGGTLAVRTDSSLLAEMRTAPTVAIVNSSVQYYSYGGVWTNTTLFAASATSKTIYIYAASDGDGRTKLMRNGSSGLGPDPILICSAEL